MAKELRIPIEEAEDCINDLLEMERKELDPAIEAKVIAAYRDEMYAPSWKQQLSRGGTAPW